jgi:hypothetical protein
VDTTAQAADWPERRSCGGDRRALLEFGVPEQHELQTQVTNDCFSLAFIEALAGRAREALVFDEEPGADGGPRLSFASAQEPGTAAGCARLWRARAGNLAARMIQVRLAAGPVETQLFFLFGRPDTVMPHFHAQVVQFSPENCVFNADFLPRLDAVDYPDYFRTVMHPLNIPYWKAISDYDNVCSHAPGNPGIAAYLSPWSIGTSRPATRAELDRVTPAITAFLDHWLQLASTLQFDGPPAVDLRARDARHLACFFDERLDPRAWKGVYRLIGEQAGHELRQVLQKISS